MIYSFVWLISLNMKISRPIHVAASDIISFFFFLWLSNLKKMGIPDHLTCLLRNLYAGFQMRKGVLHGCICHPAYLTYMWSTS